MAHRISRDVEADGRERSDFPITWQMGKEMFHMEANHVVVKDEICDVIGVYGLCVNCIFHLYLAIAACSLQLAFASCNLQLVIEACICKQAFAGCKQAFAGCNCSLYHFTS
uniref:Uncharacterized protein n=1 Tax=Tanacetum cinerariifolium TaxID=118510 RepID=A0A6L2KXG0_TANCI|nr:hypothetical protein [Tanacetum cinerariifolium]